MKDPDGGDYTKGTNETTTAAPTSVSYVKITKGTEGKYSYSAKLVGSERGITETPEADLSRDDVK